MTNTKTILFAALFALAATASAQVHLRPPADALPVPFDLEMADGTTVDFANFTQRAPGHLRGYVYIKVQGELMLVPYYQVADNGTVWRVAPLPQEK